MIESSAAYKAAIVADIRRMYCRAIIEIIDPDIQYGQVSSSGEEALVSRPEQLHDKELELSASYATLEHNRWILNGTVDTLPINPQDLKGQAGFVGSEISKGDCTFRTAQYVKMTFSNVSVLQAFSIYFPGAKTDGVPVGFTVEVLSGETVKYSKTVSDNRAAELFVEGFTVENPSAIQITATKWSKPGYRMRVVEIVPGIYEKWSSDMMASFSANMQCDPSCMTLPYGTAIIAVDNQSRRFNPRNKNGIFQSIEERQGVPLFLGAELLDQSVEYKQLGVFYQYAGGWKTTANGLTMTWNLADIIGLVSGREYVIPATLPTTLGGWVASIVALLGSNFTGRYYVEPEYVSLPVTALRREAVEGLDCGTILRFVCMATGTFPRADQETGNLYVGGLPSGGGEIGLDNMEKYPEASANTNVASLTFILADDIGTEYIIPGNAPASAKTQTIRNPFIHTKEQADFAAAQILRAYSGTVYSIVGRGDPSKELGDIETLELDQYGGVNARIVQQKLNITRGVLQNCTGKLIEVI